MFVKKFCEEIIDNSKMNLKIILSRKIDECSMNNLNSKVKVPYTYIEDGNVMVHKDDLFNVIRLHDSIDDKTFYFITRSSMIGDIYDYDTDLINIIKNASTLPIYEIWYFYKVHHISKTINDNTEIVFNVDLINPISQEYQMDRSYRTELDYLNNVSFLSVYREMLNSNNKEVMD